MRFVILGYVGHTGCGLSNGGTRSSSICYLSCLGACVISGCEGAQQEDQPEGQGLH